MDPLTSQALFVPSLPTLSPGMLMSRERPTSFPPFSSARAHYFYFARNAIWFTVRALGLVDKEVLVPAYHHGVEIEALLDAGARVRFYRVGARWDVDLDDVEAQLSSRTGAIYLIHYAGFPGPLAELRALADRHQVPLIEDCALSLLSAEGGRPLGTTGDAGIYCLYKTLPVPNGGAVVFNGLKDHTLPVAPRPPLASTASHLISSVLQNLELRAGWIGRGVRSLVRRLGRGAVRATQVERIATGTQHFDRDHLDLGVSPLSLRLARAQDLPSVVEARRRNYFLLLGALREFAPPLHGELPAGVCPLFYPLVVNDDPSRVMAQLRARGVHGIEFWRHFHPACDPARFPEVARLRQTVIELPCHQDLTPGLTAQVADAARSALRAIRRPRSAAG